MQQVAPDVCHQQINPRLFDVVNFDVKPLAAAGTLATVALQCLLALARVHPEPPKLRSDSGVRGNRLAPPHGLFCAFLNCHTATSSRCVITRPRNWMRRAFSHASMTISPFGPGRPGYRRSTSAINSARRSSV